MDYNNLIKAAHDEMKKAYAPYSEIKVGAALLTSDGRVYTGSNIENASYGATICAERAAVAKAVNAGEKTFSAIAVVSNIKGYTYPCGICRQVLAEFSRDMDIVMYNGSEIKVEKLKEIFPHSFKINA